MLFAQKYLFSTMLIKFGNGSAYASASHDRLRQLWIESAGAVCLVCKPHA